MSIHPRAKSCSPKIQACLGHHKDLHREISAILLAGFVSYRFSKRLRQAQNRSFFSKRAPTHQRGAFCPPKIQACLGHPKDLHREISARRFCTRDSLVTDVQSVKKSRKCRTCTTLGGRRHRVATSPQNSTHVLSFAQGKSNRSVSRNMTSNACLAPLAF